MLLRQHPARCQGINANSIGPKFACETAGHAVDGRIAGGVDRIACISHHIADRAEIDDRAKAGRLHLRQGSLAGKEVGLEIDLHHPVPEVFSDVLRSMPRIIGRIVDQAGDRTMRVFGMRHASFERAGVGDVTLNK